MVDVRFDLSVVLVEIAVDRGNDSKSEGGSYLTRRFNPNWTKGPILLRQSRQYEIVTDRAVFGAVMRFSSMPLRGDLQPVTENGYMDFIVARSP